MEETFNQSTNDYNNDNKKNVFVIIEKEEVIEGVFLLIGQSISTKEENNLSIFNTLNEANSYLLSIGSNHKFIKNNEEDYNFT